MFHTLTFTLDRCVMPQKPYKTVKLTYYLRIFTFDVSGHCKTIFSDEIL